MQPAVGPVRVLSDILMVFTQGIPRLRRGVVSWLLDAVLRYLRGSLFEPLEAIPSRLLTVESIPLGLGYSQMGQ